MLLSISHSWQHSNTSLPVHIRITLRLDSPLAAVRKYTASFQWHSGQSILMRGMVGSRANPFSVSILSSVVSQALVQTSLSLSLKLVKSFSIFLQFRQQNSSTLSFDRSGSRMFLQVLQKWIPWMGRSSYEIIQIIIKGSQLDSMCYYYPSREQENCAFGQCMKIIMSALARYILIINEQTDMKESHLDSARSEGLGVVETSSFKQILRDVENLVNDEEDHPISNFDAELTQPKLNPGLTNGQKLSILMNSPSTRGKVAGFLKQNGYLDVFPVLKARITPPSVNYQLQYEDLEAVFGRFDNMEKIIIHHNEIYVFYSEHHSAYFAEKSLNDIRLESAGAQLVVQWCKPEDYLFIGQYLNFQRNPQLPELKRNCSMNSKFTCRYEIQIDNDKDFQVARRIIGCKGCNMKNIIDACLNQIGADPKADPDSIKLRLRGRGSGYREGVNKTQSDDPLHLCVSCKDETAYHKACKMVQDLLKVIYQQYKGYCCKNSKQYQELTVKKLDFNFGVKKQPLYNFDHSECDRMSESDIRMYIEARNKARRELNFAQADNIRNYLKTKGITLIDEKGGRGRGVEVTTWRYSS